MTRLIDTPNLADPDGFYAELLDVHAGLSEAESNALNARLVLILSNHIGEESVLTQALQLAGRAAKSPG